MFYNKQMGGFAVSAKKVRLEKSAKLEVDEVTYLENDLIPKLLRLLREARERLRQLRQKESD